MIADHHGRCIEVGTLDESVQGMVVQMLGACDVQGGKSGRVADVDHYCALFAQGLGLFRGNTFEFAHGGLLWLG
ncbi:hypothetical protein D9M69_694210 [compost metagenome]